MEVRGSSVFSRVFRGRTASCRVAHRRRQRRREKNAAPLRGVLSSSETRVCYFDTDRLNMRSIFSFVASQHDWLACAAAKAWLAVLCAPLAAWPADCAALLAASAELLAPDTSLAVLATWAFRSSICAWMGFRSVQPTIPATAATAAAAFTTLAHFINVPFGLLIRDSWITDAIPGKQVRIRRW